MHFKRFFQKIGWYREPSDYSYLPDSNHIELLNMWTSQARDEIWLYQFILQHFEGVLSESRTLLLSSVFGPRRAINASKSHVKVFYSGENVRRFHEYRDHCLPDVDLALGFDYLSHEKYIRLPIWICYFFGPGQRQQDIQRVLDHFVLPLNNGETNRRHCSMVCSHDKNGIRTRLFNALGSIQQVDSAGSYLNNTGSLQQEYDDDKIRFMNAYKFNICPENTNRTGYVTEKIFQAIQAGTVPVYWGSDNNPEPEVLNPDAILFYRGGRSLDNLVLQVAELHGDEKKYREFIAQPKFRPTAAEYIADQLELLRKQLARLLRS